MSAIELFRFLGEDLNRPPSPSQDPLKRRRATQGPKTTRYWPGKAPEYANEGQSSSDSDSDADSDVAKAALEQDRRYSRYTASKDSVSADNEDVTGSVRRRAPAATIVIERETPAEEVQDLGINQNKELEIQVENLNIPRDRSEIRARAMAYRKEEESTIEQKTELLDQSETESEDELTDVDTEESEPVTSSQTINALAKPVFVPKKSRLTVREKKEIEREEQKKIEAEQKRLEERRKQSKELVIQTLVAENMHQEIENEVNCVDDKDELTEEEYELWKIRELKRIIRDRNERNAHERLAAEVERRREMTEEERLEDDERIRQEKGPIAPKTKIKFLQKYYHKGAFFMDKLEDGSEPIYKRDFNAPTADDCVDKSLMPKSMQVRRGQYGKMGRSKYTHLTAEDTTKFDMPWSQQPAPFTPAGARDSFDRPSKKSAKKIDQH